MSNNFSLERIHNIKCTAKQRQSNAKGQIKAKAAWARQRTYCTRYEYRTHVCNSQRLLYEPASQRHAAWLGELVRVVSSVKGVCEPHCGATLPANSPIIIRRSNLAAPSLVCGFYVCSPNEAQKTRAAYSAPYFLLSDVHCLRSPPPPTPPKAPAPGSKLGGGSSLCNRAKDTLSRVRAHTHTRRYTHRVAHLLQAIAKSTPGRPCRAVPTRRRYWHQAAPASSLSRASSAGPDSHGAARTVPVMLAGGARRPA